MTGDAIATWDVSPLQVHGLMGWQVLGVIPRTVGIGLTNVSYGSSSGETWGAGVGGNVCGAYVLLGKQISSLEGATGAEAKALASELIHSGYEI